MDFFLVLFILLYTVYIIFSITLIVSKICFFLFCVNISSFVIYKFVELIYLVLKTLFNSLYKKESNKIMLKQMDKENQNIKLCRVCGFERKYD